MFISFTHAQEKKNVDLPYITYFKFEGFTL